MSEPRMAWIARIRHRSAFVELARKVAETSTTVSSRGKAAPVKIIWRA